MYSYSHPTALVIGAGLGGIVTAARLARAGFSVKVLEKQEAPGGRCSQLIRDGHRNKQIADVLCIAETTVNFHVKNLVDKLNANDRTHAVTLAVRRGLLSI